MEEQQSMPAALREFLDGKKSYVTAGTILLVGVLHACGVDVPPYVWAALAALGLGFLRAAVKKAEI